MREFEKRNERNGIIKKLLTYFFLESINEVKLLSKSIFEEISHYYGAVTSGHLARARPRFSVHF